MRINKSVALSEIITTTSPEIFEGDWNFHDYIKKIEKDSVVQANLATKWLDYLNESFYERANCAYQSLVQALHDLLETNEVLLSQTDHEISISFQLFDQIMKRKKMLVIREIWIARKLIMFTVIVSKYPGMILRPLSQGIDDLLEQPTIFSINELFEHTFTKYQSVSYLARHFEFLNNSELQGLMLINQGTSPSLIEEFRSGLTKKEVQLLIFGIHNAFVFDDEILTRGKIISKMLIPGNEMDLYAFLKVSYTFNANPHRFWKNISYWQKGFELIRQIASNDPDQRIDNQEFSDFLDAKQNEEGFTLKGRTPNSFRRLCDEWHRTIFIEIFGHPKSCWSGMGIPSKQYENQGHLFRFEELTSGRALLNEGINLEHCVSLYAPRCQSGLVNIWSMKFLVKNKFESRITIEIRQNRIVQIKGKNNRKPDQLEMDVISVWAKENNLLLAYK